LGICGALLPLETLRKYLNDRHERDKDKAYRSAAEQLRASLELEKLRMDVVREQIELLREIGIPEERIREAVIRHVVQPLGELDYYQDRDIIQGAPSHITKGIISDTQEE
jgi:hypothetical protein